MITITNVSKTFKTNTNTFHALNNVSLTIQKNTIHGVIGPSGAGKSTLIRIINQLEIQDCGSVSVFEYKDLRKLNKESTRMYRQKVSMIFQGFNLLQRKTIFENVALPLTFQRTLTLEDNQKISELIALVGLQGYEDSYPSQLSGGQLQRVGIARSLINDPKILLCDEPTSALDTLTIKSILNLIKTIKQKLELTVVIVTHNMNVIKDICDYVTVMDKGEIVENDTVDNIIFNAKSNTTKLLLGTVGFNIEEVIAKFQNYNNLYLFKFKKSSKQQSIISTISRKYNVDINILYANITPQDHGIMLVHIEEESTLNTNNLFESLNQLGVDVRNV